MKEVPIREALVFSQGTQTTCDNLTEGANRINTLSSFYPVSSLLPGILSSHTQLEATDKQGRGYSQRSQ